MALRRMTDLAPLVDRVRELAAEEVPAPRTLRVNCWDDGDFAVRVFHTHGADGERRGRTSVRYRSGEPAVSLLRQRVEDGAVVERERRVLAELDEAALLDVNG